MKNYNRIQFPVSLDERHDHVGTVMHFQYASEIDQDITLDLEEEDFLGLVMNLAQHGQPYHIGDLSGSMPKTSFNFFYVPRGSCTITLTEGLTSLLFVKCPREFLRQFERETVLFANFLNYSAGVAQIMNNKHLPITPVMLDDVREMMTRTDFQGGARALYLETLSCNMVLSAMLSIRGNFLQFINDSDLLEMQSIYQYMVENLRFIKQVSTLAARTRMSEKKFRQVFKTVYGQNIQDVLRNERLKRAAHLLRTSTTPIYQIATDVGYGSSSSFIDAFRAHYKMSPNKFREENSTL